MESDFKGGNVLVRRERFAVIQSRRPDPDAFASISDDREITVIVDETKLRREDVIRIDRGWKVLTLDIVFPFDAVGITAAIATALAEAGVSILPVAAYSRDHFLVGESDLEKAADALQGLGLTVERG